MLPSLNEPCGYLSIEGRLIFLGALIGIYLSWMLSDLMLMLLGDYRPGVVKDWLYVIGVFVAIGIVVAENRSYKNISAVCIVFLALIGVLVFGSALEWYWTYPNKSYFLIGGLIPSSDAAGWIEGAWRLLHSADLSIYSQRRPINAALLALWLYLTGNLQNSILLLAMLAAISSIFAAWIVRRSLGWTAAVIFFITALALIHRHLPLTMTEVHGYIFGCLAFPLLWRAAVDNSVASYVVGLALFSIALSARSGPFIVLPMVLIWGAFNLSSKKRVLVQVLLGSTLAVFSGFILTECFQFLWSGKENIQHSNFSLTLYGMAVGGKGWLQAFFDHPEIVRGTFGGIREAEISQKIFYIAMSEIFRDPTRFISYYFGQLEHFIRLFMKYELGLSRLMTLIAGIWLITNWRDPLAQLVMSVLLGILLSAPFLMADAGVRPFTPVFVVFAMIPALAVGCLVRWLRNRFPISRNYAAKAEFKSSNGVIVIGLAAILITSFGPLMAVTAYQSPIVETIVECDKGKKGIVLTGSSAVVVKVLDTKIESSVRAPSIRYREFLETFPGSQPQGFRAGLEKIVPPFSFILAYDPSVKAREIFVVRDQLVELDENKLVVICLSAMQNGRYKEGYILNSEIRTTRSRL